MTREAIFFGGYWIGDRTAAIRTLRVLDEAKHAKRVAAPPSGTLFGLRFKIRYRLMTFEMNFVNAGLCNFAVYSAVHTIVEITRV